MVDSAADTDVQIGKGDNSENSNSSCQKADILYFHKENKTRTEVADQWDRTECERVMCEELGLRKAWRDVVDFGDPKSSGVGEMWGHKRVSVSWVSILNGTGTGSDE